MPIDKEVMNTVTSHHMISPPQVSELGEFELASLVEMAVSKLVSGFECEFVEKPPEIIQTECLICLLVLREPYQVICCGKSFCRSCIGRVKALNNPCPHCNEKNFTDFPNKGLQQPLYQLEVRCTYQQKGCDWTGELGELDNHLNVDPQPANQLKGCVFVMVKCSHCSESHRRQHIKQHQNEECPKRPFTCEHCKVYKSTFEDVTINHWPDCEYYPVECPNKCGAVLQRRNLKSHEAKDCPLTIIDCDFNYAGCEVRLPRKDMGEHLRVELVKHTSMMAVSYQQQITSQQKQIASHEKQITSQQQQIASYKQQQDHDRQENEALKQRVTELERLLMEVVQVKTNIPPFDFIMPNFEQHKKNSDFWYSPPFYTHHRGYKLCLRCYANGIFSTHNHVSVYFYMMRGEFDDELKWPFCGEVTLQLLSQDGSNRHHTKTITIDHTTWYSRVTKGERCDSGKGEPYFISHDECRKRYIKNDSLHFRIVKVELK